MQTAISHPKKQPSFLLLFLLSWLQRTASAENFVLCFSNHIPWTECFCLPHKHNLFSSTQGCEVPWLIFYHTIEVFLLFLWPPRSPWLQSWVALLSEKATRKLSLGSHFPSNKFQWRHTNISPTHLKGPAPYRVAFHSQNAPRKGFSSFCTTPQGGNSRGQWLRLEAVNAVKFPVHQGHLANPWSWASPGWRDLEGPSAAKGGWVLRGPEQLSQREGLGFAVFLISMIITSST